MGATREDFSTEWMTYSELRTVFATAARRLRRPTPRTYGTEGFTWARK